MPNGALLKYALLCVVLIVAAAPSVLAADEPLDYYALLGLGDLREDATEQDIKRGFRKMSKEFHPDVAGESARETYVKVQRANEVLSNRRKRKIYDMKGEEGLEQLEKSEKNPNAGAMDPFLQMFGFGGQQQGNANKGKDQKLNLNVPLQDIYNGRIHQVKIKKTKLCKQCKGTRAATKGDIHVCPKCNGKGVEEVRFQLQPGFYHMGQRECSTCGGRGKTVTKKCDACGGKGVFKGESTLDIEIERGIPEGHQIIYEMEADQSPDVIPGDVIVEIHTTPDANFKRKENDLEITVKLTLRQAALGFEAKITHMDGRAVPIAVQGVTQHGTRMKIAGEGMPIHTVPSERGDLYVTFNIEMPRSLTTKQRKKIEEGL